MNLHVYNLIYNPNKPQLKPISQVKRVLEIEIRTLFRKLPKIYTSHNAMYCIAGNFCEFHGFVTIYESFLCQIWGHAILWHSKSEQSTKYSCFFTLRAFFSLRPAQALVLWMLSKCKVQTVGGSGSTLTKRGAKQLVAQCTFIPQKMKASASINSAQTDCRFYFGKFVLQGKGPSRIVWCCRTSSGSVLAEVVYRRWVGVTSVWQHRMRNTGQGFD